MRESSVFWESGTLPSENRLVGNAHSYLIGVLFGLDLKHWRNSQEMEGLMKKEKTKKKNT